MSEVELIEACISTSAVAIQTMMFYLTIVTGYLVVSHFSGADLLKGQILFVNTTFVVSSAFSMWGSVGNFDEACSFLKQSATHQNILDEEIVSPGNPTEVLEALGIAASLQYMYAILPRANLEGETK